MTGAIMPKKKKQKTEEFSGETVELDVEKPKDEEEEELSYFPAEEARRGRVRGGDG